MSVASFLDASLLWSCCGGGGDGEVEQLLQVKKGGVYEIVWI